jgi:hypothetical protein
MARANLLPVAVAFAILGLACATVELPGTNDTSELLNSNRKLQQYRPIPIDASLVLLSISDVEGGGNSECVKMVDRAKQFRGRSINFFVTFYYADYNGDNVMDKLGYRDQAWDSSFRELTYDAVQRYQRGLTVSTTSCKLVHTISMLKGHERDVSPHGSILHWQWLPPLGRFTDFSALLTSASRDACGPHTLTIVLHHTDSTLVTGGSHESSS